MLIDMHFIGFIASSACIVLEHADDVNKLRDFADYACHDYFK